MPATLTPKKFVLLYNEHGSVKAVFRAIRSTELGLSWVKLLAVYRRAVLEGLMQKLPLGRKTREDAKALRKPKAEGRIRVMKPRGFQLPPKGEVYRYLFTCAQNNTKLHEKFWTNLLAFAGYHSAEIHVSRFAYIKSGLGASGDKATSFSNANQKERFAAAQEIWWDDRVTDYLSDNRAEIAPGLVWCGEMNILPTAARPLSGLEVYTGRRSGIFPSVKLAMDSIASARGEPTKFNYTTGTVTLRNYIQRKAGLKAEFHHCYGALLVEVDSGGDWFCRQINASSDGTFYDLDVKVKDGEITDGHRLEAITWGDIHVAEKDELVYEIAWGDGGMLDALKPKYQFFHDVLHFRGRSHHEMKNPHMMFRRWIQGFDDIRMEVSNVAAFLREARRPWCTGIIVDSNHHHHLGRWLQEQDGRADPVNSEFWLAMSRRVYEAIRKKQPYNYLYLALQEVGLDKPEALARFLDEDESFILCLDEHGGIEGGMHGDQGPNGARGSALAFAKMGRRMNRGHEHSAGIVDGVFTSGTCGELNPDWTHGPSSWSASHTLTYENGKRAIATMWSGKWRAEEAA